MQIEVQCHNKSCQKVFLTYNKQKKKYCSNECFAKCHPQVANIVSISRYNRQQRVVESKPNGKKCIVCEKDLVANQRKLCSSTCNALYNQSDINLYKSKYKTENKIAKLRYELINLFGGECCICKYNTCQSALIFHHLDPKNKISNLDKTSLHYLSKEQIIIEVQKCIVLCSNCHAEVHAGIITELPTTIIDTTNLSDDLFIKRRSNSKRLVIKSKIEIKYDKK